RTSTDGNHGFWREQFLGEIGEKALKAGDLTLVDYILTRFESKLQAAKLQQKVANYFVTLGEMSNAVTRFDEMLKLLGNCDNQGDTAIALFKAIELSDKIAEQRTSDIAREAIKV